MPRWRDIRAVLTSASIWAVGWAILGAAVGLSTLVLRLRHAPTGHQVYTTVLASGGVAALYGALSGTAFALLLLLRRRLRGQRAPTTWRWLTWGAAAGLAVPALATAITAVISRHIPAVEPWWLVFPLVGASTTAVLARVARSTPELPDVSMGALAGGGWEPEPTRPGLAEEKVRQAGGRADIS